jgi:hypothetical protein
MRLLLLVLVLVLALELQPAAAQTAAVRVEVNEDTRFVNRVLQHWRWKGHAVRAVLDHQEPKCAPPSVEERNVIRVCKKRLPGALIGLYDFTGQVAYVEPRWWDAGWVICHEIGHGLGYTHADRAIWACPGGPHPGAGE